MLSVWFTVSLAIPHIFTILFFSWHEWLPTPCLRLFHLSISYLQLPSPDTLHTPDSCSSTTLARSPPPHFPPVWNHRVWPLNSKAEPVLPPTLQVTFLNRGNVRPDARCSYTPIFPRMFLGYVHVTMRPKRPDPHPPTQRLDDNQVEHWLCAENFNPWPFDWG